MENPKRGILATLIHISDLHFGSKLGNDESALRKFLASLPLVTGLYPHSFQVARSLSVRIRQIIENRKAAGVALCVVCTGDLTRGGELDEFTVASTFLRKSHAVGAGDSVGLELGPNRTTIRPRKSGLFIIPGNHDIWRRSNPQEYGAFQGHFQDNYPTECKLELELRPIYLYGLDTTRNTELRHRLARGKLSSDQLEKVCKLLRKRSGNLQIVCLHHPLRDPIRSNSAITMQLEDRDAIGEALADAGANLVLAGHVHVADVQAARNGRTPHHVIAGTALQQFSDCSFNLIDIYADRVSIQIVKYYRNKKQFDIDGLSYNLPI